MLKKLIFLAVLLALLALPLAGVAQAKVEKFTFTQTFDGQDVTIYASLKTNNKGDFTHCGYHSADTQDFLGYYEAPTTDVKTAGDVEAFCVDHFEDRVE